MVLGTCSHSITAGFRLLDCHHLWWAVPDPLTIRRNQTSVLRNTPEHTRNPVMATREGLTPPRFGLLPVRSPLLGQSQLMFFPVGTEMFHFPTYRSTPPMYSAGGLPV